MPRTRELVNELEHMPWSGDIADPDGNPLVPDTLEYRLTCLETDTVLIPWTTITPTVTYDVNGVAEEVSYTFTIASTYHAMQTTNKTRERKCITLVVNRGAADEDNDDFLYDVVRLKGRSD